MAENHSSVTFPTHRFLRLAVMIAACHLRGVRGFSLPAGVPTSASRRAGARSHRLGGLASMPWRGGEGKPPPVCPSRASRTQASSPAGAASAWPVGRPAAVCRAWASAGLRARKAEPRRASRLGREPLPPALRELLARLLQLLLEGQDGTLHALHLLFKVQDEAAQLVAAAAQLLAELPLQRQLGLQPRDAALGQLPAELLVLLEEQPTLGH